MSLGASALVLYVRDGCHLCDQFLTELTVDLGVEAGLLQVRDVDHDPELASRFGLRVPVLEAHGTVLCEGVYDGARVRHALRV